MHEISVVDLMYSFPYVFVRLNTLMTQTKRRVSIHCIYMYPVLASCFDVTFTHLHQGYVLCSVIQTIRCYVAINLLKPTDHVMHQQFNIQQLYVLPTLYLCVLYLSENKQRLVSLTA